MALRQYVGARYVPKFSDVNGGKWDNTYTYKPLTIVKHGNDYYTSKKEVPTGIDITNTEYWVLTGNYNGAVAELHDEIDALSDSVDDRFELLDDVSNFTKRFKNKKVVIYGDSLSVPTGTWAETFKELVESIGGTVTNHAVSGASTANQLAIANTDETVYDYAIVWLGTNDSHNQTPFGSVTDTTTFNYKYNALLSRILTVNNTCQVFCFGLPYSTPRSLALNKSEFFYSACIRSIAFLRGCCYKSMEGMPNNGIGNNTATSDGTHFTAAYTSSTLIYCIINKLCNMTTEDDMVKNLSVVQSDYLTTVSPGVTVTDFNLDVDIDGNCVLSMWFEASGLTSQIIATTSTWITPKRTTYTQIKNHIVGLSSKTGQIQTDSKLEDGRYCFQLIFQGRWITSLYLTEGT